MSGKRKRVVVSLQIKLDAIRYVEQQEDTAPADLLLLRCLWNIAAKKRGTAIKQKTGNVDRGHLG
jgi:hypothetical protein